MDPDSKTGMLFKQLGGGSVSVKPIDLVASLPRHPTKRYDLRSVTEISKVVVHTTDWDTTPEKLAEYDVTPYFIVNGKKIYNHISKTGCPGITYHEGISKSGQLVQTLGWEEISWHAGNHNNSSLGIALYYKSQKSGVDVYAPTLKQMQTLWCRCGHICLSLDLRPSAVVGHRELSGTGWFWEKGSKRLRKTCPGLLVNMDEVRLNVAKYMQCLLKMKGYYDGEIDGDFGPLSQAAQDEWV